MISTKARWVRHSSRTAMMFASLGALATPLAAQETPSETAAAAPAGEEAIVVTGSRIARETYDPPAPVIGVSSEDPLDSGDRELSETLADLPHLSSEEHTSELQSLMRNATAD